MLGSRGNSPESSGKGKRAATSGSRSSGWREPMSGWPTCVGIFSTRPRRRPANPSRRLCRGPEDPEHDLKRPGHPGDARTERPAEVRTEPLHFLPGMGNVPLLPGVQAFGTGRTPGPGRSPEHQPDLFRLRSCVGGEPAGPGPFRCVSCDYCDHADVNAAKNIFRAGHARRACSPKQPGEFVA